jgi:hypothetical protein
VREAAILARMVLDLQLPDDIAELKAMLIAANEHARSRRGDRDPSS